jgi:desumoylating isopeptidase 1
VFENIAVFGDEHVLPPHRAARAHRVRRQPLSLVLPHTTHPKMSAEADVVLHVYDLSMGMASALSLGILGQQIDLIPHTGVCVRGKEYFFGGGIQCMPPHQVVENFGLAPIQKLTLGRTAKSDDEIRLYLRTISPKYTFATYDLFTNNCNNFSDTLATFLLQGRPGALPVPENILSVPRRVLSTPMGAMIGQMMRGMQENMGARMGANDPFTALAAGRGDGGGAAAVGADMFSGASAAPPPAPAPAPAAPSSSSAAPILPTLTRPFLSADAGIVPTLVKRLHTVSASLPADSPHVLSPDAAALLESLPSNLLLGDGEKQAPVCTPDGVCALPFKWQRPTCVLLASLLRQWPRARAAFPVLGLVRLLALRDDCIPFLVERDVAGAAAGSSGGGGGGGGGGVLWDVLETVAGGKGEFGGPAANSMALICLANTFKTAAGAAWACSAAVRGILADAAVREVRTGVGQGASAAATASSASASASASAADPSAPLRQGAAALLFNLANALPVGSDTAGVSVSSVPGDASVQITDTSVQLLCGALEDVAAESDAETVRRRLHAGGRLLTREGAEAGALLHTLGYTEHLAAVVAQAGRPADVRALAVEVLALVRPAQGAF